MKNNQSTIIKQSIEAMNLTFNRRELDYIEKEMESLATKIREELERETIDSISRPICLCKCRYCKECVFKRK